MINWDIQVLIREISIYSIGLPLISGILFFSRGSLSKPLKIVLILTLGGLISDITAKALVNIFNMNMPWLYTYQFIETCIILYFFKQVLSNKTILKIGFLLLGFLLLNPLILTSPFEFDTSGFTVKSIYFMVVCLVYFFEVYSRENILFIEKTGVFWIVTALLIYFSGSFFTFLTYERYHTWVFHNLANITKNALFTLGFIVHSKQLVE